MTEETDVTASRIQQALSHARNAFPQLKGLRHASLSLAVVAPGHKEKFVGISAPAWPTLIAHMSRYQIIDVQVAQPHERERAIPVPEITITYADADDAEETEPAPPYPTSDVVDDEKASYPRPRSPSTSTSHPKRSWFFQKLRGQ